MKAVTSKYDGPIQSKAHKGRGRVCTDTPEHALPLPRSAHVFSLWGELGHKENFIDCLAIKHFINNIKMI